MMLAPVDWLCNWRVDHSSRRSSRSARPALHLAIPADLEISIARSAAARARGLGGLGTGVVVPRSGTRFGLRFGSH